VEDKRCWQPHRIQGNEQALPEVCTADEKALAGEAALSRGSARDTFAHCRQLRSACPHMSSPILNANGSLISDKVQKTARWCEYYEQLLSRPPTHPPVDLAQTSTPEDTTIDCGPPTVAEVAGGNWETEGWQSARNLWNSSATAEGSWASYGTVADEGLPCCLAIWADAIRLEERNYPPVIQRKGQQEGMQELQRHHPTVYTW